jgi:hypothetical protein
MNESWGEGGGRFMVHIVHIIYDDVGRCIYVALSGAINHLQLEYDACTLASASLAHSLSVSSGALMAS